MYKQGEIFDACVKCTGFGPITVQAGNYDDIGRIVVQEEVTTCAYCKGTVMSDLRSAGDFDFVRAL